MYLFLLRSEFEMILTILAEVCYQILAQTWEIQQLDACHSPKCFRGGMRFQSLTLLQIV